MYVTLHTFMENIHLFVKTFTVIQFSINPSPTSSLCFHTSIQQLLPAGKAAYGEKTFIDNLEGKFPRNFIGSLLLNFIQTAQ